MEKTVMIEGMSCNHCKMHVEKALGALPGVKKATVDLAAKNAKVELTAEVSDAAIRDAVSEAGYEVTGIK
ncbi:MAG: heavy-metal-associated domain-containing protein [Clostridiales bacterium]|nr:heavy-metal-associated domain-containing protein [Clostridiales bacterium]